MLTRESVALELADSPLAQNVRIAAGRTERNPTPEQKATGQYRKGRVEIQGLVVAIENPELSHREGVGPGGKPWQSLMTVDYGYIEQTDASDGDACDVFLGPRPESELVVVVDQVNQQTGAWDEPKALIGWDNRREAVRAYLDQFEPGWKVGQVVTFTMDQFKAWLQRGGPKRPAALARDAISVAMELAPTPERAFRMLRETYYP